VNQALGIMGKQPVLSLLILLAPVLTKIVDALKENETALGAVNKLAKALEPVVQFLEGILEKIAGTLAKAVDWVLQLGEESGISFRTIVAGAVGVGNSILQFILTPVRTTIEAVKGLGNVFKDIFTGQFKQAGEDAKNALRGIGDAFKKGIDFKGNFESGKEAGEAFINGLKSTKKKAGEAAKEISQEVEQGLRYSADRILKIMQEGDRLRQEQQDAFLADLAASEQETADEISQIWAEYEAQQQADMEKERERVEARKTLLAA
jgi:phage-related protein